MPQERGRTSIHGPSPRIAQGNQLPGRVLRWRQWRLRILRYDRQYLSTADPLNGQALTLYRKHPVFFIKDFAWIDIHNALGCSYPTRRLQVKSQKISSLPLDNHQLSVRDAYIETLSLNIKRENVARAPLAKPRRVLV